MRRIPILATLATLLVACGTSVGAPSSIPSLPSATAAVSPSPMPSPTSLSSPTPPPATPFACPPLPSAMDASLELRTATGVVSIPLEAGVAVPLPSATMAPVDPGEVVIEGTVLGGSDVTGTLMLESLEDDPGIAVTAVTARFVPLDASAAAPVVAAIDGASVVLQLPDKDASGRLFVALDWTTSCGTGAGGGGTALTVVNSKVAVGCPTTDDEMLAALQDLGSTRITIGGIAEPLDVYGWSTRWTPGNGVTDFGTLFPNWDRATVISVAPGANVAVREAVDDLRLVSVRAGIYRRADVDAYFEPGSSQDIDPVTVVRRDVNPKGNVNIPAPLESGAYVFDVDATWLTSCFELQTTRSVSVTVR